MTDSARLVAGLRAKEPLAFTDAYELFGDRLYSFALRLTNRRDAADELFQHAWLTLAERGVRLAPDTNLLPWLLTVARNHFRSQHRRVKTRDRNEAALRDELPAAPRPDVSVEQRAVLDRLERGLQLLAEHHREVLVLMIEADDMSQHDLAAVLGVSHTVFRKRLSRARKALAMLLESPEDA